jgi:hypothetical protein
MLLESWWSKNRDTLTPRTMLNAGRASNKNEVDEEVKDQPYLNNKSQVMPHKHNYKEILASTSNMSKANLKNEDDNEAEKKSKVIIPKYFSLSDKEH